MHVKYQPILFFMHTTCARAAFWLPLLYSEIIAVYSEILTKQIYEQRIQNVELLYVKPDGI